MTKLYVIQSEAGHVKVGISSDPQRRRKNLEDSGPLKLNLIHVVEAELASDIEKLAHKLLEAKRIRGEWYSVSPDEAISAIQAAILDIAENGKPERRYGFSMRTDNEQGADFLAALDRLRLAQRPTLDRTAMVMKLVFEADTKTEKRGRK